MASAHFKIHEPAHLFELSQQPIDVELFLLRSGRPVRSTPAGVFTTALESSFVDNRNLSSIAIQACAVHDPLLTTRAASGALRARSARQTHADSVRRSEKSDG